MKGASLRKLAVHQFRYDFKVFRRNPAALFFTVALPLIFLVIFSAIFGSQRLDELGGIKTTTYYVPGIVTLAVISATFVSMAIRLTEERESGSLKRLRGTPLPTIAFVLGRVGNSLVVSTIMLVVVTIVGRVLYGVEPPPVDRWPALVVTLLLGAAAFSCLGIALTVVIPSFDAAPAVTNFAALPLYFISGVFIPETEIPDAILSFADIFPIRHFFRAFYACWDPVSTGSGFEPVNLAVIAIWGLFGFIVARLLMRWEPRR